MPEAEAATYRINPFDLTKVWHYRDYPLIPIGKLMLNRLPENFFAEVEQAAFDPAHFVPGIGPSPDRMLQARLFAYGDAHRYRLGINHTRLEVNEPKGVARRRAQLRARRRHAHGRAQQRTREELRAEQLQRPCRPRRVPALTDEEHYAGLPVTGVTATITQVPREVDDFKQAGDLYRLQPADAQQRLVDNIAGSLAQVSREDIIERSIEHFRKADPEYGRRIAEGVAARRSTAHRFVDRFG